MNLLRLIRINLTRRCALNLIRFCRKRTQEHLYFVSNLADRIGLEEKNIGEFAGVFGEDAFETIRHILLYWICKHMEMMMEASNILCKVQKRYENEQL